MPKSAGGPITVALVDDYDVVLMGVANMFDRYRYPCRGRGARRDDGYR
jgi:hypothetical protein